MPQEYYERWLAKRAAEEAEQARQAAYPAKFDKLWLEIQGLGSVSEYNLRHYAIENDINPDELSRMITSLGYTLSGDGKRYVISQTTTQEKPLPPSDIQFSPQRPKVIPTRSTEAPRVRTGKTPRAHNADDQNIEIEK